MNIDTYCQRCKSSAWTLVSGDIRLCGYSVRFSRKKTLKDSGVGHALTVVYLYASISRKWYEIRPKLLLTTNRKLHMRFRLAPRSMTLDDLELLYVRIFSDLGDNNGKTNEDRPVLSATEL